MTDVQADGTVARGLILFAHGARDARWAEPFERLAHLVGERVGASRVSLAYLEMMTPDLDVAAARLVQAGCDALTIVPVFFGQGGHLRRDLPRLVDALKAKRPAIAIDVAPPVGEDDTVIAALAAYCVGAIGGPAP